MDRFDLSLIGRVRRGELNFERLVEVLSERGHVTDVDHEEGLSFIRSSVNQTHREDFDALFKLLMPGRINDIDLRTTASSEGTHPGTPTYAVFNANVISYDAMMATLADMNRAGAQD
ncbi:hypothetical protein [Variovorax paradoxus]|uniref:hypothetical protein n=1 Tax=Variovorax paradoxus TaxID=34073 RepID=UPI0027844050|nr:hypothetical protein [Variovorax paradoxus]MDP9933644.1 hypothetical protein [Variovorax paradoxus]